MLLAQWCPALAQSCDEQLALAKSWASSLQVRLSQAKVTVGSPIDISWQTLQTLPASSDTQVHLVFGVGQEARLGKTDFFALTPGAKAPSNIAFASNTTRAYFPVQRLRLQRGDFSLTSLRKETLLVSWAVVLTGGTCGEQIAGGGSRALDVTAGRPELVIQDTFATERPIARIRSLNGKYDLLQFKERYEVQDVATGAKLIERAGVDANFSPTSRFLVGRKGTDRSLEIIDLLSRQLVASVPDSILVWLRNDSYVISAANQWGGVLVQNTIVDGAELLRVGASCHGCTAWDQAQVVFNMDQEYVAVFGDLESAATDLATRRTFRSEQTGDDEAKLEVLNTSPAAIRRSANRVAQDMADRRETCDLSHRYVQYRREISGAPSRGRQSRCTSRCERHPGRLKCHSRHSTNCGHCLYCEARRRAVTVPWYRFSA
jgi:hypothetical protein